MKLDCLHFATEHMAVMSTLQRTTLIKRHKLQNLKFVLNLTFQLLLVKYDQKTPKQISVFISVNPLFPGLLAHGLLLHLA